MSELSKKVHDSIERLKSFAPRNGEGYYLAFSGGKDSVVCKALLDMAGVKYDAHYANTSVDPPELVRFIMDKHPDVKREWQTFDEELRNKKLAGKRITMWNLIPYQLYPPTRIARYCCKYLKESAGDGRFTVTGVRWAESVNRKKNQGPVTICGKNAGRKLADDPNFKLNDRGGVILVNDNEDSRRAIEHCYQRLKTTVNPIIDWTDNDVWEFIKTENIPYCGLYDEGFKRLGCIGCPMAGQHGREIHFLRWPKYKSLYITAFSRMLSELQARGKTYRACGGGEITGADVFNNWMEYDIIPGQIDLFDPDVAASLAWLDPDEEDL